MRILLKTSRQKSCCGHLPDIHLQTMSASRARHVGIKSSDPWLKLSSRVLNLDISSTIICARMGTLLRLKRTPMCRRRCACSLGSLQRHVRKFLVFFLIWHSRNWKKGWVSILNELVVDSRVLHKFTASCMYALVNIEGVEGYFIGTYSNQRALKGVRTCCRIEVLHWANRSWGFAPRLKKKNNKNRFSKPELTKSLV